MKETSVTQKLKYIEMMQNGHMYWQTQMAPDGSLLDTIIFTMNLDEDCEFLEVFIQVEDDGTNVTGMSNTNIEVISMLWYLKPIKFDELHIKLRRWIKSKSFNKEFKKLIGGE